MNETKTPDIQAMLEWLASCPLAASLNDGDVAFSIDYLGAEPVSSPWRAPRPRRFWSSTSGAA
jgi:hypothetical protein